MLKKEKSILESAREAIAQASSENFKPAPYEKKVLERAMGILKGCGLLHVGTMWETQCDETRALTIVIHHTPDAKKGIGRAMAGMAMAFRKAHPHASNVGLSVDGYAFEFPAITLEFKSNKPIKRR